MADSPAAEHRLDELGVRALLRTVSVELAALPLRLVAEGWDNAIWRLGDELAVRVPRRQLAAPLILNEQRALPLIGPPLEALGIRTPVPIIAGAPTAEFPWAWSVVPWIDGDSALGATRTSNGAWAPRLASALMVLHRPAPPDAPHNPFRGVPLVDRDAAMQERLGTIDGPALGAAWTAGLRATASAETVWVHGDLHPGNILVADGQLTAIIDFGDVTAGDPAYDLASAWLLFDRTGRVVFRGATGQRYDADTWVRARAWAAYLATVLLTQSDDRPALRAVGESTAAALGTS